jgi:hypothetical protein
MNSTTVCKTHIKTIFIASRRLEVKNKIVVLKNQHHDETRWIFGGTGVKLELEQMYAGFSSSIQQETYEGGLRK